MNFSTLKPEAFGLDISDLSLKIIKLEKKRGGFNLASFGKTPIKSGIIKGGEIKNEKALVKIIKEALSKIEGKKIRTKYVVASLPEEKSFLQVIQMPRMSKEDLKSAVIYEAENYVPLPIEEVYLDHQIIPPVVNHLDHFDVLIVAIPKKTVELYLSCLKKAGLIPKVFETESSAISRALIKNEMTTNPITLIDLGATKTRFIVFSGYTVRFTGSIPVSSQSFTEIISKALGISLIEAEELKIKYGLERKNKTGKEVFEALVPVLTDLTEQIKKYLSYYQTHISPERLHQNGKGVEKILLCGGGAKLKGLIDVLSSQLEIPVEMGNPWINILPEPKKEIPEFPSEKYTTALGLALRGVKNNS